MTEVTMMKRIPVYVIVISILICCLCACAKEKQSAGTGLEAERPAEYAIAENYPVSDFTVNDNYRVFYEIFVGSFSDSDGDGKGDIRGITNRMDYLNDGDPASGCSLGIEGIWLTPVFTSPSYHKYDVADYYSIDPEFGTMDDLKELIRLCHERNVKLILDMPLNHTSSENQWFENFCRAHRNNDKENLYYDFYSWIPEGTAHDGKYYREIDGCKDLYECNFSGDMPELNFNSPYVYESILNVAEFYLDMGIDGFRFDAAKYIFYGDNNSSSSFWETFLEDLRSRKPDIYTVAEVWDTDSVTEVYYRSTNCFDFSLSQVDGLIARTAKGGDIDTYTSYIQNYLDRIHRVSTVSMIVPFISNHDQDRAAGYLPVSEGRMQMAANLYLLGPGSPFIYYGEELGMKGSRGGADTDANRRLAMVWNDGDTVTDPPGSTYSRQIEHGASDQLGDGTSLYNYYKKLIMIRNAYPEIARGVYRSVQFPVNGLGGFTALWRGSSVCVLHNVSNVEVTVDLAQSEIGFSDLQAVAGMNAADLDGSVLTIGALTSVILK